MDRGCATALRGEDRRSFGLRAEPVALSHIPENVRVLRLGKKSQLLLKDGWQLFIDAITQGNRYRGPGPARHDLRFPTEGRVSHSDVATDWLRQHSIVGGTPAVPRRSRGRRGPMQGDWRRVDGEVGVELGFGGH